MSKNTSTMMKTSSCRWKLVPSNKRQVHKSSLINCQKSTRLWITCWWRQHKMRKKSTLMIKSNKNSSMNRSKGYKIKYKPIYHHSTKLSIITLHKQTRSLPILTLNLTCWNCHKIKNYRKCKISWIIKSHNPHWTRH